MFWLRNKKNSFQIHILIWRPVKSLIKASTGLSPPVEYFTDRSKAVLPLWIFYVLFCLVFAMSLCASVYMCFKVTCWERADLLALF